MSPTSKPKKISFLLSPESQSRIKLISGITMSNEDSIVEEAISLLFEYAPREIDKRITLDSLIDKIRSGHQ